MGLCARLPRRPSMGICAGRASRVAGKSPGDIARGELSFPPFFGDPKKGGAGVAGARSPRGLSGGFPCVPCYDHGKTMETMWHWLGRALAPLGTAPTQSAIASLANG